MKILTTVALMLLIGSFSGLHALNEYFQHDKYTTCSIRQEGKGVIAEMYFTQTKVIPKNKALLGSARTQIVNVLTAFAKKHNMPLRGINKNLVTMSVTTDKVTGILCWTARLRVRYIKDYQPKDYSNEIYINLENKTYGPFTKNELNERLASGELIEYDWAWHEGMDDWVRLRELL